ncbi:hypothetical protein Trydic_g21345 [Trypoxylus dichotomus]
MGRTPAEGVHKHEAAAQLSLLELPTPEMFLRTTTDIPMAGAGNKTETWRFPVRILLFPHLVLVARLTISRPFGRRQRWEIEFGKGREP